jgi:peptidoglycan/LPS O-acetylase OafA/YrhL
MTSASLQNKLSYRADIDGLRGIAVLAVVIFHAFPKALTGGFVGVDIFFVISGYLIGRILLVELQEGTFHIARFYGRRARRIFPALIVVLSVSAIAGWFTLFPDEYKQLGLHIAAGAGFVSNLTLWREAGYFDSSADVKPLLHLWSLGVEEQFYIVFPLLLWLASRLRANRLTLCMGIAALCYALNVWTSRTDLVAAFYSPLTRMWELVAGSTIACAMLHERRNFLYVQRIEAFAGRVFFEGPEAPVVRLQEILSVCGLAVIALSMWFLNSNMRFPGWWALAPVLAACMVILAGPDAWFNRVILANRALVLVGLISFPLYLWHWPLLSFARILETHAPSFEVRLVLVCTSFLLAWLTYRFVERPVRYSRTSKRTAVYLSVALGAVGFLGFNDWKRGGLEFRPIVRAYSSLATTSIRTPRTNECFDIPNAQTIASGWFCHLGNASRTPSAFFYGDSHALSMIPVFEQIANESATDILFTGFSGCPPLLGVYPFRDQKIFDCQALNERIFNHVKSTGIKDVILTARWSYYTDDSYYGGKIALISYRGSQGNKELSRQAFLDGLQETVTRYKAIGVKVHLLTDVPFQILEINDLFRLATRSLDRQAAIDSLSVSREQHLALNRFVNNAFERLNGEESVDVINLDDVYCGSRCPAAKNGTSMYMDSGHQSIAGSLRTKAKIRSRLSFSSN